MASIARAFPDLTLLALDAFGGFEATRQCFFVADVAPNGEVAIYLCDQKSLLATLPETTFFGRYRETFTS